MGQLLGKAELFPQAIVFANLPHKCVSSLWQCFNDYADGFGITKSEFQEITAHLHEDFACSTVDMRQKSIAFFELVDTDHNGLADALEILSTIAAISGMKLFDVIHFILSSYDFDGQKELSLDEVTLALKSLITGLCKISRIAIPKEQLLETLVSKIFEESLGAKTMEMGVLSVAALAATLSAHPDVVSWFHCFSSPDSGSLLPVLGPDTLDVEYSSELASLEHTPYYSQDTKWRIGNAVDERAKLLPWFEIARNMAPAEYSSSKPSLKPPASSLELAWVYGYESERAHNNLFYDYRGRVVYTVGRYVVVFHADTTSQSVFNGHSNQVSCLAMHPDGQKLASGDTQAGALLLVWDVMSLGVLFSCRSHRHGVAQVAFSNNGAYVAAVGNSTYKCLTVHDWASSQLLYSSVLSKSRCYSLLFLQGESVAAAGDGYVFVWTKSAEEYLKRRGNFSAGCPVQPVTCLALLLNPDSFVSGGASGHLYLWHDRNAVRRVKAHEGPVTALYSNQHAVVSGGKDRRIRLWTHRLEPGAVFDVTGFGGSPSIRSLCLSKDAVSILLGTKGSDIFEISAVDGSDLRGGPVVSGHCAGGVRGVAACRVRNEVCTVGDDGTLRIWDLASHTIFKTAKFDAQLRCVAYSPAGDFLAIGMGDRAGASSGSGSGEVFGRCGAYAVLNEQDLAVLHEARDALCPLSVTAISGDGETLAFGAEDGTIHLYAVLDEYEYIGKCVRHSAAIISIDFSTDCEIIRTNSVNGELYFFSSDDGSVISNISSLRDVRWESGRAVYDWHSVAAHDTDLQGEVLTAASRLSSAPRYCCATNFGYIKLYTFPVTAQHSGCHRYPAHSGPTASLAHSPDDAFVFSAGLVDRCVLQWRVKLGPAPSPIADDRLAVNDYGKEAATIPEVEEYIMQSVKALSLPLLNGDPLADEATTELKDLLPRGVGVDSWLGAVVSPSNPPAHKRDVPSVSLSLEHVYGFSCADMRNNVRYSAQGEAVFVAGTAVVVASGESRVQRFCRHHDLGISAFACTDDGQHAATGQTGLSSKVVVWRTLDCSAAQVLSEGFINGVSCLSFSADNVYLVVASLDLHNTVTLFDWRNDLALTRVYSGLTRLHSLCFNETATQLVSCSANDVAFYDFAWNILSFQAPKVGDDSELNGPFLSCLHFGENAIVSSLDGHMYVFRDATLKTAVKAHAGAVDCLYSRAQSGLLVSGGKDGRIKVWSSSLDCVHDIPAESFVKCFVPGVSSVALNRDSSKILVGTRAGQIFEFKMPGKNEDGSGEHVTITEGHSMRELHGVAAHPTRALFATAGDDATLKIFESDTFTVVRTVKLDAPSRAVAFSSDGKYLAVGFGANKRDADGRLPFKEGGFAVYQVSDFKKAHEAKDSSEPIRVIRFSPDNRLLAVGSEDTKIHIYTVEDLFSVRTVLTCHRAPIRHLDFTSDGQFIMSVDAANKVCYSESTSGVFIPSHSALRDEKWTTWTNPIGWPTLGVWMSQPDGAEVRAVQKSCGGGLIATGSSTGTLAVWNYPCPARSGLLSEICHSDSLADLAWIAGDTHLITIGESDHLVFQWRCVYDSSKEMGEEAPRAADAFDLTLYGGHEWDDTRHRSESVEKGSAWRYKIVPPVANTEEVYVRPSVAVSLEHVHGIRFGDSQYSLRYNARGNAVYITGKVVVIQARDEQLQLFYRGHSQAIVCLEVDSAGLVGASGGQGGDPELHLWDAETGAPILAFAGIHRRGITCASFGRSGEHLATLGQDPLHGVVVLRSPSARWHDGYLLCSMSTSPLKMLWVLYMDDAEFPIVVGGKCGLMFFRSTAGIQRVVGVFGKDNYIQPLLCAVPGLDSGQGASIITGTPSGHVYEWRGAQVAKSVIAHDTPVTVMASIARVGYATGAGDGTIKVFSAELKLLYTINALSFSPLPTDMNFSVLRSNLAANKLAIGMKSGEVYELTLQTRSSMLVLQTHHKLQLHGLAASPSNSNEYITAGDDGFLLVWDVQKRACVRKADIDVACRAVCWSPDGTKLAVGCGGDPSSTLKDGAFMVLDAATLQILFEDRKAKMTITDIAWSRGDAAALVAMASADGKIYFHDAVTFDLIRAVTVPESKVASRVEFSRDSMYLRAGTTSQEVFDVFTRDGSIVSSPVTTQDTAWISFNCCFHWLTQGVWRTASKGVDVTATAVHLPRKLVGAAYRNGDVRIYSFLCVDSENDFILVEGVCTQAHRICFSADGSYLIAIDSYTRAVLQFKIDLLDFYF